MQIKIFLFKNYCSKDFAQKNCDKYTIKPGRRSVLWVLRACERKKRALDL